MAGRQRAPLSGPRELIELWRLFCGEIVENKYVTVPTVTEFVRFVARCRQAPEEDVARAVERHFPAAREAVERMRADVLSQGSMLGKYQSTMSTLAIKNWCGWADKQDPTKGKTPAGIAAAAAEIERLMAHESKTDP